MELDRATDLAGDASRDEISHRPTWSTARDGTARLGRRSFLSLALSGTAALTLGPALSACGATSSDRPSTLGATDTARPAPRRGDRTLLVYFSRAGENYWYGGRRNLRVGNTEILARLIRSRLDCDTYRIEAADPYPTDYEQTVQRNVREQDEDARPKIANPLPSIARYDTVLLGSPIWNVRPPMIMLTFTGSHDFSGKTVLPFVTYAVSGLGTAEADYRSACRGAQVEQGLAIRGEKVRDADSATNSWLRRHRLLT